MESIKILLVPVRASSYRLTALRDYQSLLEPDRPLANMTAPQRDQIWVKICEDIEKAVNASKDPFLGNSSTNASPQTPDAPPKPLISTRNEQHANFEWRWFVVGCVLLLVALVLTLWGFSIGTLTSDQRRLLVFVLSLASGFAAAAFAGSIFVQARNFIPGVVVTATGGFAVWFITFFALFPETKVSPALKPSSRPEPSSGYATPQPSAPTSTPGESKSSFPDAESVISHLLGQNLVSQVSTPLSVDALSNMINSGRPLLTVLDFALDRLTPNPNDRGRALNTLQRLWYDDAITIGIGKTQTGAGSQLIV